MRGRRQTGMVEPAGARSAADGIVQAVQERQTVCRGEPSWERCMQQHAVEG